MTIRTLDLGGDKTIPYLGHDREANPFLGWHRSACRSSIRSSSPRRFGPSSARLPHAGSQAEVRIMFPMITTLEEMRRVRAMVHRVRRGLRAAGGQGTRSADRADARSAGGGRVDRALLEIVDFVSIGSNDLVQYLMAADRDNPKVSHLCQPLSPPVLKVLNNVITACNRAGKPVTLCGEMAGQPRAFVLLFGMGLRSFSMSPAFIPMIKDLTRHLTVAGAEEILAGACD